MRPSAAQSKSSRPPSPKGLKRRLPRTVARVGPVAWARSAAAAGKGESAPATTWASPATSRASSAIISSVRL